MSTLLHFSKRSKITFNFAFREAIGCYHVLWLLIWQISRNYCIREPFGIASWCPKTLDTLSHLDCKISSSVSDNYENKRPKQLAIFPRTRLLQNDVTGSWRWSSRPETRRQLICWFWRPATWRFVFISLRNSIYLSFFRNLFISVRQINESLFFRLSKITFNKVISNHCYLKLPDGTAVLGQIRITT